MLSIIKQKYVKPFRDMPANIKLVVILTVSVFLPVYITVSAIVASFLYIVCNKSRLKSLIEVQHINLLIILAVLLLVIPLYYKNYYGFLCGILFIIFIVLEIYISKFMSSEILNLACDICCGMSLICIFASIIQKVFENQQRVEGLTYNPNFYAYIIELVVVICFYKIATSKKSFIYIFIAVANMIALCFTGCRSGWGALLAGLFVLFLLFKKRKYIGVLLALLVSRGNYPVF